MDFKIIKYSDINPETLKELFEGLSLNYLEHESMLDDQTIQGFLPAYPNISTWYKKVIQEIKVNSKNREMFIALSNVRDELSISGLLIVKNHTDEKKICTLRVRDDFQRRGIGSKLFECAFEYLNTNKPLITVPEESVIVFEKIFQKYSFDKVEEKVDLYRKGKIEYIYNSTFK